MSETLMLPPSQSSGSSSTGINTLDSILTVDSSSSVPIGDTTQKAFGALREKYAGVEVPESVVGKIFALYANTDDALPNSSAALTPLDSVINKAVDFGVSPRQAGIIIEQVLRESEQVDDASVFESIYVELEKRLIGCIDVLSKLPGHNSDILSDVDGEKIRYSFAVDVKGNVSISIRDESPGVRGCFGPIEITYVKKEVNTAALDLFKARESYWYAFPGIGTLIALLEAGTSYDPKDILHDAFALPFKLISFPLAYPILKGTMHLDKARQKSELLVTSKHKRPYETVSLRSFLETQTADSFMNRDRVISEQFALNYLPQVVADIKAEHTHFLRGYSFSK